MANTTALSQLARGVDRLRRARRIIAKHRASRRPNRQTINAAELVERAALEHIAGAAAWALESSRVFITAAGRRALEEGA